MLEYLRIQWIKASKNAEGTSFFSRNITLKGKKKRQKTDQRKVQQHKMKEKKYIPQTDDGNSKK